MANLVQHITNVLTPSYIDYILNLPQVLNARSNINNKTSGSVYFTITLTDDIKTILYEKLGLDLSNVKSVPMRWIKGDTMPHIDTGASSFDNTYLMYLTNSSGELVLDTSSYPIVQGDAFIFNEGINHETINTGLEPRLLLGPMSEEGFAVGYAPGIYGPGNTTVYVRQSVGDVQYSSDQEDWYDISWPCTVQNTDTTAGLLRIEFISDITIDNADGYFVASTSHIQFGSTVLQNNGTRPIITIDGVADYPGFVQNGTDSNNGNGDIYVFNLEINAINGSTLYASEGPGSGWVAQQHFGKGVDNNYIINCSSNGPINVLCGGIVGPYSGNGGELVIIGCSSSGSIGYYSGGIVGSGAGTDGSVTCKSCWSTGEISDLDSGGIIGSNPNNVTVENCYTTGHITGERAGGIVGGSAGSVNSVSISNCYTTGNIIGSQSGGILGALANIVTINNCYTTGNVVDPDGNNSNGAICGLHSQPNAIQINNCYSCGTVDNNGYLNGKDINNYVVAFSNFFSEAQSGTPGAWNTTNANTVLLGLPIPIVGSTWVATTANQPYELFNMGYTPYSTTNITFMNDDNYDRVIPILIREYMNPGDEPDKDMSNDNYTAEFNPNNYQAEFFPSMADFIDGNIIAGDKDESDRLNASYWDDLGNDIFDDWGYFYLYDVNSGKYYFPLISPQNQDDNVITTQTFNAFDRTFSIKHGWIVKGVFKFEITVNDLLPFRFGAYGNMGSDGNEITKNLTHTYTIGGTPRTLYYRFDAEEQDDREILYSYFVPRNNSDNNIKPFNVYYNGENMSMISNELTTGLTVYFGKSFDVKDIVVKDLKYMAGEGNDIYTAPGNSTNSAIISNKSYTILQINKGEELVDLNTIITVNSVTGVISTTSNITPGIYTIFVRNNGSYNITVFYLIVALGGKSDQCIYKYYLYRYLRRVNIYERHFKLRNVKSSRKDYTFTEFGTGILDWCTELGPE